LEYQHGTNKDQRLEFVFGLFPRPWENWFSEYITTSVDP